MLTTLIAALLLAPETAPVQLAASQQPIVAAAAAEQPTDEVEAEAAPADGPAEKKICRRSSVQRGISLVTQSRKVCRTLAQWRAAGGR